MTDLILLFGGISDERLVSVASAQNLVSYVKNAELWFVTSQGSVIQTTAQELLKHERPFEVAFAPSQKPFATSIEAALQSEAARIKGHVIFIGLHGTEGEDGSLQRLFEKNGVRYTGSRSQSSAMCFDKNIAKEHISESGLTVPMGFTVLKSDPDARRKILTALSDYERLVAKPSSSGSSFGLRFLNTKEECEAFATELATCPYNEYLIEQCLVGRELTVGIIERDGGKRLALPPSEVIMQAGRSFDYQGKYLGRGSTEVTPAELTIKDRDLCQSLALQAHIVLGCHGYSRTDMILTKKGPVFLETNTLPGLTKASFVPQQLQAAQIPLETFIQEQIIAALKS